MPELKWDPFDFFYCLEVEPEIERRHDYEIRYIYKVEKDDLILTVIVRPVQSIVWLSLVQQESQNPLVEFWLFVRGKVRHVNDKRGNYLEFADCVIVPSRFSELIAAEMIEKAQSYWQVELSIKPHIQIRYLD